ncbi:MAG: hypothetical protein ABIJ42_10380 [Acidobacteriota bacterium]
MKKTILMAILLLTCTLYGFAASPAVGTWDCIASVDQDYPFTLIISEVDGALQGTAESPSGEAGPVDKVKLENGVLTFSLDTSSAGMIDFEATLDGDTLKGALEGYDLAGEFTATLRK